MRVKNFSRFLKVASMKKGEESEKRA